VSTFSNPYSPGVRSSRLIYPVIDNWRAIEKQPNTVIDSNGKQVHSLVEAHISDPPRRKVVWRDSRIRCSIALGEVDSRINPHLRRCARQCLVVIVHADVSPIATG
jgi:hypothetical protein